MNGVYPPQVSGGGRGGFPGQRSTSPSSASSYSILTNPSAVRSPMENSLFSQLGNSSVSMTDVTIEQALEKVQELAAENTNLRGKNSKLGFGVRDNGFYTPRKTRNWLQARLSVYPPQNYLRPIT